MRDYSSASCPMIFDAPINRRKQLWRVSMTSILVGIVISLIGLVSNHYLLTLHNGAAHTGLVCFTFMPMMMRQY